MVPGARSITLSFVLFLMPYVPLISGIIGLFFAARSRKDSAGIMADIGFSLSILGIVLSGICMILWVACNGILSSALNG